MGVTNQPTSGWDLNPIPEDLMGLESLDQLRQLTIKQRHPGFLELAKCFNYENKYDVLDENGTPVFFLQEESDCIDRCFCANKRELTVSFQDLNGQELLKFDRPYNFWSNAFFRIKRNTSSLQRLP